MLSDAFPPLPPSVYGRASELAADIRRIELENAELRHRVIELESGVELDKRTARALLNHLEEKINRRLVGLRKKLSKAQENGDLAAAALADARIRALADLLDL